MEWEGEFRGPEACWASPRGRLAKEGENIPGGIDPKDWKVVFLGEMEDAGGLPPSPWDCGAIAGLMFIPDPFIWLRLSCPIHSPWTPTSHRLTLLGTSEVLQLVSGSSNPPAVTKTSPHRNHILTLMVHSLSSWVQSSNQACLYMIAVLTEDSVRKCATCLSH